MELLKETKLLMKKYNITANKRLGQNFLIDEEPIIKAIEAANITKEDLVIEIGPGLGTLTKYLLEESGKVICIELDERMLKILNDRFIAYDNFQLINDDVLKVNLKNLIKSEKTNEIKNVKIVANLPYYITTPIIMKLLEERLDIKSITVMVQKEVADRLVANPGEEFSGAITYSINYYTNPEKVIDAPSSSFLPAPEVDSAIIKLEVLEQPKVKVLNEKTLFKVIKLAFMQKRKTLLNAFSNGNLLKNKNDIEKMLESLNIDLKIRGEKLTLEQFAEIADYIEGIKY